VPIVVRIDTYSHPIVRIDTYSHPIQGSMRPDDFAIHVHMWSIYTLYRNPVPY